MSERPANLFIEDIWEALGRIERYIEGSDQDRFRADEKTVDAVARNLEIIGEAASRLSDEFKDAHSDIEWRKIVGLRHRIVHDYFGLDLDIIWQILQTDLQVFKTAIGAIRQHLDATG
ncbi:MAG: DUF86 domain-containing protein [Lentisphaerales bacterium]|jgi:uncharacterized protein with HEPN domain|nr:MAG: DUF86 domain-containing protein [Lentisphaerales bacterium]